MNSKRILCLVLALLMLPALAACGDKISYRVQSTVTLVEQEYSLAFRNDDPLRDYVVAALEELLGEPLLERTGHAPRLTAAGSRAYPLAKRILADCAELTGLFAGGEGDELLLLGASTVPGQYLLPGYLAAFLPRHPKLRYKLRRGDSEHIHRLCRQGDIRLGFVGAQLEPASFDYLPLVKDTLVLVTQNSQRYRTLKARGAYGRDLLSEPTVAREEGSGTDRTVQIYMSGIQYPKDTLNILARVEDPETIKHMVARGVGVSVLSALAVAREVEAGELLSFEMDPAGLHRDIYLIRPKDMRPSRIERQFIGFLKKTT